MSRRSILAIAFVLTGFRAIAADIAVDAVVRDGEALLEAGEVDAAVALLEQAVVTDPRSATLRLRLGGALLAKQDYPGALERFRETLALDPSSANAFVGLSVVYLHQGRYELARAALEEAIRIDPGKRRAAEPVLRSIEHGPAETPEGGSPQAPPD